MKKNILDEIHRYDNVFSDDQLRKIWRDYLSKEKWKFGHLSSENSDKMFWKMNLEGESFFEDELLKEIERVTDRKYKVWEVFANGQTFGLDADWHIDHVDYNAVTFLHYPIFEWDISWSGETIFDWGELDCKYKYEYVLPQPNCGILFPAHVPHYGRSPSREYKKMRITLVWKLFIVQ